MAEDILISDNVTKEECYKELLPQIAALIDYEDDLTANLANIAAALKYGLNFFWVGFYRVKDGGLILGPFQGPVACTRIASNKGVCGASYTQKRTVIVDDVDKYPGHIACSSLSKSEIVIPIMKDDEVLLVLDVDSEHLSSFDEIDERYLNELALMVQKKL
ncbi:GAF domain-containing protein [uncultured Acetobacteroides sp.]|uniref:GAF domain-containing protein n=1 Tax=uncultured Acetobacteroides sp. TaxID=1760811 RepID=UPI0029F5A7D2|nr:GAF domain-containing protein [uncultured Acetobacteroides sp.]